METKRDNACKHDVWDIAGVALVTVTIGMIIM